LLTMSGVLSFFSSAIFIIASFALFRYYLAFTQIHVLPLPVEISEDSQVTADIKPNALQTESPKSSYSNPDLIPTFPKLEDASLLNHWSTSTSQHPPSTSTSPPKSSPPPPPPRSSSLPPPPRSSPHPSISSRWSPPPTPAHLSFPGGPLLVSLAELAMLAPRVQPVETCSPPTLEIPEDCRSPGFTGVKRLHPRRIVLMILFGFEVESSYSYKKGKNYV